MIKKTSEASNKAEIENIFSKEFSLPAEEYNVRTHISYGDKSTDYTRWEHPYCAALEELERIVNKFNDQKPRKFYDAYAISETMMYHWTILKISRIRELVRKVPEFKEFFKHWLNDVQVLVEYYINKPKKGWVNDGVLTLYYTNGPGDKIRIKCTSKEEASRFNEEKIKRYFPGASEKPFLGVTTSIRHYLEDKFGN